jgi:hypothetical protein
MKIFLVNSANLGVMDIKDPKGQIRHLIDLNLTGQYGPGKPAEQLRVRLQPEQAALLLKALKEEPAIPSYQQPGTAH